MTEDAGLSGSKALDTDHVRVFYATLRQDLASFVHKVFCTTRPNDRYLHNWHIDVITWHLQQCFERRITRLIITIPPRSLKSICASVAFPAWILGRHPSNRVICVSYSNDLSRALALDCRTVMEAPWYKRTFPRTRLHPAKNTELEVMTTKLGFRLATSVGGTLTGRGGNFIIIDDPMKPADAMSDVKRATVKQFYDGTLYSRLDNKAEDVIIVIMQRLHVDDLVAHLIEKEEWVHLDIPAIAEQDEVYEVGPGQIYRRKAGEVLHPEQEPRAALDRIKTTLGTYDFSAQYQQSPMPPGGGMIKWDWFRHYRDLPQRGSRSEIVQSWDTASKASELSDYSVCTTWQVEGEDSYLIDVERARLEYPQLKRRVIELKHRYKADAVLIEDKGSGISLIQDLNNEGLRCIRIQPEGDKVTRMSAVSARIEAGYVRLPDGADWLQDFQTEVMQFPNGRHDDQVDSLSQFLNWLRCNRLNAMPDFVLPNFYRPSPWPSS